MVRRVPMLVLMNAQVDGQPLWRKLWGGLLRAVTLTEVTGWLAGAALYPVERRLVRVLREGPGVHDLPSPLTGRPPAIGAARSG